MNRSPQIHINQAATYVVDISKLRHPDDVKKDNFGIWSHSGSHPQSFKVFNADSGHISIEKCAPGAEGHNVVQLRRLHSVHPVNNQFKRMIAFVTGKYNNSAFVTSNMILESSFVGKVSWRWRSPNNI